MIETIDGKTVVKCDGCGEVIESYGFHPQERIFSGECFVGIATDTGHHYCDVCVGEHTTLACEFRICDRCGAVMTQGFASEDDDHVCEECFEPWMDEVCPDGWRPNDHGDDRHWDGGYYDERIDGAWADTGIYWTQWD